MTVSTLNRLSIVFAALGLFVAGYLTLSHYQAKDVFCGTSTSCADVLKSPLANVGGIPTAAFGLAAYVILLLLSFKRTTSIQEQFTKLARVGFGISAVGFLISVFLIYYALAAIGAQCYWCMASAAIMTVLFALHGAMVKAVAPEEPDKAGMPLAVGGAMLAIAAAFIMLNVEAGKAPAGGTRITGVTDAQKRLYLPAASRMKGDENAKVTVVEYMDVNCPPCRLAAPMVEELIASYGGKVRLGIKHAPQPIPGHETSPNAASLLTVAESKGKFWELYELMMDPKNEATVKSKEGLKALGKEVGLTDAEVNKGVDTPDNVILDTLSKDLDQFMSLNPPGTPLFLIVADGKDLRHVGPGQLTKVLESAEYADLLK